MHWQTIIQMDTVLDHLTGEEIGNALETLNNLPEILDSVYLTGIGKKNRPAGVLQVLCLPENEDRALAAIFRHTHSLGVRRQELRRAILPRRHTRMDGSGIPVKEYDLENETYSRPEADAVAAQARKLGVGAPAMRFGKNKQE